MKRPLVLLGLMLLVALAACGGQTPEAETQPTVDSAVETLPTEVPAVEEPAPPVEQPSETTPLAHTADPALVNKLWYWERRDPSSGATPIEVPNPSEYNLIFNDDGTFLSLIHI